MIPTLNEEKSIGKLLDRIAECDFFKEIMVVDGGSTDGTITILKSYKVTVINQKSKGKGGAVIESLQLFDPNEYVVMIDGDGTYDPMDAKSFLPELVKEMTFVNGSRFLGTIHPGSLKRLQNFGNHFLNYLFNVLYHTKITDFLSGLKGFHIKDLLSLQLVDYTFAIETEIMQKAVKKLHVVELPINYYPRLGKSKLHPFRDGFLIARKLVSYKWMQKNT